MQTLPTPQIEYRHIEVVPNRAALGAEVRCGDVRKLNAGAVAEIRAAWLRHLVLFFRAQQLTDPELVAFGRHFGELLFGTKRPAGMKPRDERVPEVNVISNVIENGLKIGNLGDGEAIWHTDRSHQVAPLSASMLYALEVPPAGGDTSWGNMYLAFETLPDDVKHRIAALTINHDANLDSGGNPRADFSGTGANHPIVRTHPDSGHSALYLGRKTNSRINELPAAESVQLLDFLWRHATQPQFVWTHRWAVGDLLMWDNRCTIHHRQAFDPATRRIMHRLQVAGTQPFRAPDALARAPHPRDACAVSGARQS
jgi:taurine dioxygenase